MFLILVPTSCPQEKSQIRLLWNKASQLKRAVVEGTRSFQLCLDNGISGGVFAFVLGAFFSVYLACTLAVDLVMGNLDSSIKLSASFMVKSIGFKSNSTVCWEAVWLKLGELLTFSVPQFLQLGWSQDLPGWVAVGIIKGVNDCQLLVSVPRGSTGVCVTPPGNAGHLPSVSARLLPTLPSWSVCTCFLFPSPGVSGRQGTWFNDSPP